MVRYTDSQVETFRLAVKGWLDDEGYNGTARIGVHSFDWYRGAFSNGWSVEYTARLVLSFVE